MQCTMKAEGMDYDERMGRARRIRGQAARQSCHHRCCRLLPSTNPWVDRHPLSQVGRGTWEGAMDFGDYVHFPNLARSGAPCRHLSDVYKALVRTVPGTPRPGSSISSRWLGELVRQVDSSLLDGWEELHPAERRTRDPDRHAADRPVTAGADGQPPGVHPRSKRHVPTGGFLGTRQWNELEALDGETGGAPAMVRRDRSVPRTRGIGIGSDARSPDLLLIDEHRSRHPAAGSVRQILTIPPMTTTGPSSLSSTSPPATTPAEPSCIIDVDCG